MFPSYWRGFHYITIDDDCKSPVACMFNLIPCRVKPQDFGSRYSENLPNSFAKHLNSLNRNKSDALAPMSSRVSSNPAKQSWGGFSPSRMAHLVGCLNADALQLGPCFYPGFVG